MLPSTIGSWLKWVKTEDFVCFIGPVKHQFSFFTVDVQSRCCTQESVVVSDSKAGINPVYRKPGSRKWQSNLKNSRRPARPETL